MNNVDVKKHFKEMVSLKKKKKKERNGILSGPLKFTDNANKYIKMSKETYTHQK